MQWRHDATSIGSVLVCRLKLCCHSAGLTTDSVGLCHAASLANSCHVFLFGKSSIRTCQECNIVIQENTETVVEKMRIDIEAIYLRGLKRPLFNKLMTFQMD